jgi:hypothetical protein
MTYQGRVTKTGTVQLDPPAGLPAGTAVTVRPVKPTGKSKKKTGKSPSLYSRMKPFIAAAKGLPPDLAENHDHYLYGRPKK